MRTSSTISLFSEQHELDRKPFSFLFSGIVHVVVLGLIFLVIVTAPKIKPTRIAERYVVRHLDLESLESQMQRARDEVKPPRPHTPTHAAHTAQKSAEAPPQALRMAIQAPQGEQTLVQPDLPKPVDVKVEIPVPTVVVWSGKPVQVKTIVAPAPAPPPVADVKPSTQLPNDAPNLADTAIPASAFANHAQPILAATTTPVVISGPKPTPPAPLTTAKSAATPTPSAVLSLSDHQMAKGPVNLPPVNTSAIKPAPGTLAPAKPDSAKATGASKSAQGSQAGNGQTSPQQEGMGLESSPLATHILRAKEGHFGSVVVGSALQDRYPEMIDLLSGRMSYSVFVPVGLPKSWILEYSLPRADEIAEGSAVAHLDAPWPFNIVRPNIAPGSIDADALMVHGFVNQQGRFEALTIAFPPQFPQAQFVLSILNQWQFRPATQNGQNVKVEILLIIPDIEE
jgi:hypothetical protein